MESVNQLDWMIDWLNYILCVDCSSDWLFDWLISWLDVIACFGRLIDWLIDWLTSNACFLLQFVQSSFRNPRRRRSRPRARSESPPRFSASPPARRLRWGLENLGSISAAHPQTRHRSVQRPETVKQITSISIESGVDWSVHRGKVKWLPFST